MEGWKNGSMEERLAERTVLNRNLNRTLLPWSIMSMESGFTVQQFYDEKVVCKLSGEQKLECISWHV